LAKSQSIEDGTRDPLAVPRKTLFAPLRKRVLAEAAGALAEDQVAAAEALVAGILEKKPGDPDALNLMAEIARRAKRFDEAEKLLVRCVEKSPGCLGFRYNYAVVLRHLHKYEAALSQIDELLRKDPANPLFRDQKALILTGLGRHHEALAYRRVLNEQFPQWPEGWLRLGNALRDAGCQAECIAAWRRARELDTALTGVYSSLAALKVYRFTAGEIREMENQLATASLSHEARSDMHHALGKAYADTENFARSFENYAKGNALRRLGVVFDVESIVSHRHACEENFTQAFFCQRTGWGCRAADPIFIIGLPRSGSTLIEQILSSHSAIEGLGELADLDAALVEPLSGFRDEIRIEQFANGKAVTKTGLVLAFLKIMDRFSGERFRAIGERYLDLTRVRRTTGRPFFTDKALGNFFYVGLIQLMLPNARIIDARRHPLDCGWSCFRSQFPGSDFTLRLADIGSQYIEYVRLMAHFDRALPGKVYRVIHENLIADPETELRRLFDYLGLPFDEQCLRFHENRRPVFTQSSEQVRQPLNTSGVGQWQPYEPWLAPLKKALGAVLDQYPHVPQ
jgi:tetratricopeptide (TPR) repeat protein